MKRLTATTALLALAAAPACAAVTLQDIDVTGDSFATFEEVRNAMPRMELDDFHEVDLNGDNRLSAEEIREPKAQNLFAQHQVLSRKERVLSLLDADGDGFMSFEDMTRVYPSMTMVTFDQIDGNKDHRLSYAEFYTPKTQTAIAQCAKPSYMNLADMDQDGDKYLSMEELKVGYPGATPYDFDTIDLNKDNRVSAVELLAPTAECLIGKDK
jgi:hypothetical protein